MPVEQHRKHKRFSHKIIYSWVTIQQRFIWMTPKDAYARARKSRPDSHLVLKAADMSVN